MQRFLLCLVTSSANDMNALMYYIQKWKMVSNTLIHATHLSHIIDNYQELKYSIPHISAAIFELHLQHKIE